MNGSKHIIIFFILFFVFTLNSYSSNIDSLIIVSQNLPNNTEKVDLLHKVSNEYRGKGEVEKSIEFIKKAIAVAQKINYQQGLSNAYGLYGLVLSDIGSYSNALDYHFKALRINESEDNEKGISVNYSNIGVIYKEQKEYEKAIEYLNKSLEINLKLNRKSGLAASYGNLGIVYSRMNEFEKAIEFFNKSLEICTEINNKAFIANNEVNIAGVYFRKFEQIEESDIVNRKLNSDKAIYYFNKALESFIAINNIKGICSNMSNLGIIYVQVNDLENGKKYLLKSDSIAKEINYTEVIKNNYRYLSELYEKNGDNIKALKFYKEYETLKDSLLNTTETKKSLHLEMQYNIEKIEALSKSEIEKNKLIAEKNKQAVLILQKDKELQEIILARNQNLLFQKEIENENKSKEIKLLSKEKEVKEAQIKAKKAENKKLEIESNQQKQKAYFLYSGLVITLIFIGFIYNRFKITQKQKEIILLQKNRVDEINEELNQTNEEILAQRDAIELQKSKLEIAHNDIQDSIKYAKRIQEAILPSMDAMQKSLKDGFVLYKAKAVVAGDFYWLENYDDKIYFAAADCTGHGVPGAMVSVMCSNALSKALTEEKQLETNLILDKTREIIIKRLAKSGDEIKDGMDISLARIDFDKMELQWSGANNPIYIIRNNNSEIEVIKGDKQPIGYSKDPFPFTKHSLTLQKGDSIYLFTDGYADQFGGEEGKKLGYAKFREKIIEISKEDMDKQKQLLLSYFNEWKGKEEQIDDVCIIGIRI